MQIQSLELRDFRNYDYKRFDDLDRLVIFHGPNAAGKTNVLEAIHLITTTTSFRHPHIEQLVRKEARLAHIQAHLGDGNRQLQIDLGLEPGRKRFSVNGKPKAPAEVKGMLPAVSFVPDDLDIAKKSSSLRRDTIDNLGVQLSKSYDVVRRDYEKALRYKNRLLKDEEQPSMVDAINETLVSVASQLFCFRRSVYKRIIPLVAANYEAISQGSEAFGARYLPSWVRMEQRLTGAEDVWEEEDLKREQVAELLYRALQRFGAEEQRARRSFIGPHNDQISFFLSGNDASSYASQGQQRSIVLAWKLAEVQLVQQVMGTDPVLLLDDVMSELDETRRNLLVQAVGTHVQTFITCTDLSPFNPDLLASAQVIAIP